MVWRSALSESYLDFILINQSDNFCFRESASLVLWLFAFCKSYFDKFILRNYRAFVILLSDLYNLHYWNNVKTASVTFSPTPKASANVMMDYGTCCKLQEICSDLLINYHISMRLWLWVWVLCISRGESWPGFLEKKGFYSNFDCSDRRKFKT